MTDKVADVQKVLDLIAERQELHKQICQEKLKVCNLEERHWDLTQEIERLASEVKRGRIRLV